MVLGRTRFASLKCASYTHYGEMTMSKTAELKVLDDAIKALPAGGYLKEWLTAVHGEVERMVRDNVAPSILDVSITKTRLEVATMIQQAQQSAKNLQLENNAICGDTLRKVIKTKDDAKAILCDAADSLRGVVKQLNEIHL